MNLKAQLTELKGRHTRRVRGVVDQRPALEVGEGIIVGLIFLQRQPDQKFCGRLALMPGKEQRKTFELRDGTVVISKLEQMETKIVHSRGRRLVLLCLGWHRCIPSPKDAEQQADHLELASQRRMLHATCTHSKKT